MQTFSMRTISAILVLSLAFVTQVMAQDKPILTQADYGQWERLGAYSLSENGEWVVVSITRVDEDTRLELHRTDGNSDVITLDHAKAPVFSADNRWLAFRQSVSKEDQEKAENPIKDRLGLVDLETGRDTVLMAISRLAFRDDGKWLAVIGAAPADSVGGDLLVFEPGAERRTTLGSVSEFAWQDEGTVLAYTLKSSTAYGNGVSLFSPGDGRLQALSSGDSEYTGLTWKEESATLAAFRSVADENREGDAQDVLYWNDVLAHPDQMDVLESASQDSFGDSLGVNSFGGIQFAPNGVTVFVGTRSWLKTDADASLEVETDVEADSSVVESDDMDPADVQIWHWDDDQILRGQEYWSSRNAQRTLLTVWHVEEEQVIVLGSEYDEPVSLVGEAKRWGIVGDKDPDHVMLRFNMGVTDWYKVDTQTGERTLLAAGLSQGPTAGPAGHYVLLFEDNGWTAVDLSTMNRTRFEGRSDPDNRGDSAPDFAMGILDYDTPGPSPSFRSMAWLEGDAGAYLSGRFDLWKADFATGTLMKVTDGEARQVRYRPVSIDPEAPRFGPVTVQAGEDVWTSTFNLHTKDSGYAVVSEDGVDQIIEKTAQIAGLEQNMDESVFAYTIQKWDDSPDIFVGSSLKQAKQLTNTNSFQDEWAWGHAEILQYTTDAGHDLQAVLAYPANFEPGKKYPLILYQYEKLSSGLHRYELPRERSYYNNQTWSQQGYFVLLPDIVYEAGRPGPSALDAVNHALDAAIATGHVDETAMGLIGHSWGGYQAAYLPTRTDRFAASVAGAAITDFISFPGTIHWSGGAEEFSHWERGQARMAMPPWENLEGHLESSPINFIDQLNTPVLVMHGDDDGVVDFRQGQQYYNYARRAGKPVVMLVYPGAGHSLREETQQVDYHHRILEWFGHYLKGEAAADWIVNGESWEERTQRLEN
ncbi:MAG: S9 family peptidase [Bacteroidetes Order II. Incertae sedis bacterium]|nr:S9 family peptidase [Bacteroidetes Order II. bacterium]MBT6598542.1 S9 family peptidase [Bacteroidetes Order II. bacterium]